MRKGSMQIFEALNIVSLITHQTPTYLLILNIPPSKYFGVHLINGFKVFNSYYLTSKINIHSVTLMSFNDS